MILEWIHLATLRTQPWLSHALIFLITDSVQITDSEADFVPNIAFREQYMSSKTVYSYVHVCFSACHEIWLKV